MTKILFVCLGNICRSPMAEFVMRERDFGMADGVALAMTSLCGWLYDDDLATAYLRYEDDFAYLRRALDEGYFEDLIREVFLDSAHMAEVEVVPVEKQDDPGQRRLAELAAGFADDDFQRIEDEVVLLRRMQEAPDAPEDVAKLPQLSGRHPSSPPTAWPRARPFPASAITCPRAAWSSPTATSI